MDEYTYVVNVDCAVVRDGEYLFIERAAEKDHAAGTLAFPGGKLERSSDREDAIAATAARELREEVGVEVSEVEYVHSRTFEADYGAQCLNVVTLCTYEDGEAHPRATDEVDAVHWLAPTEVRAREDVPDFLAADVERVEDYRREDRR